MHRIARIITRIITKLLKTAILDYFHKVNTENLPGRGRLLIGSVWFRFWVSSVYHLVNPGLV